MSTKKPVKRAVPKKAPAKKVIAKKPVKKASVKKSAKKTSSPKPLQYSDDSTSFWMTDGQVLNSLLALRDALSSMEEEVFSYHVTDDKNDFADWVESVLCDESCAKDLVKVKTPQSAKTVVVKHLKYYII